MRTIFKYQLLSQWEQVISMPAGAKILTVQMQHDEICLWVECCNDAPEEGRIIYIFGTGHDLGKIKCRYIGSVQQDGGHIVWHFYDGGQF